MLIMWRRSGESLLVGEGVEIEVLDSRPNRVKLGIIAPDSVAIVRKEVRITQEANVTAAWSIDHQTIHSLVKNLARH